jgi:alkylated DNA repair dioxygenase AlkB
MKQKTLFHHEIPIPGLRYIENYISEEHEVRLVNLIDLQPWNLALKRRTQHYGYRYDYAARSVDGSDYLGSSPDWIEALCHALRAESIFVEKPDQAIVNEYLPGQGIAPHIDCLRCFSDTIASLSLAASCTMNLTRDKSQQSIALAPRSLLILQGEVRFAWKHGIAARKSDDGLRRQRRLSLTFRKVIL